MRSVSTPISAVGLLLSVACASQPRHTRPPFPPGTEGTSVVAVPAPDTPEAIQPEVFASVAPHVAGLRARPSALRIMVGDTLWLDGALRIGAIDSLGRDLGRLSVYDSRLVPGAARLAMRGMDRFGIVGRKPGTSTLHIEFPRRFWGTRADSVAAVDVPIEVSVRP